MPLALPPPLRVRHATESDREFLLKLEEETMRDHAIALCGEWRPREPGRPLIQGRAIIMDGPARVGCIAVEHLDDCFWIDRLYLLPSHQRQGIGTSILHDVIREAEERNLPVRLTVLTPNPALAFYLRLGLRICERTPERFHLTTG